MPGWAGLGRAGLGWAGLGSAGLARAPFEPGTLNLRSIKKRKFELPAACGSNRVPLDFFAGGF